MRLRKDLVFRRVNIAIGDEDQRTYGPCPYCGGVNRTFVEGNDEDDTHYSIYHQCPGCGGHWTEFLRDHEELPWVSVLYAVREGRHREAS